MKSFDIKANINQETYEDEFVLIITENRKNIPQLTRSHRYCR